MRKNYSIDASFSAIPVADVSDQIHFGSTKPKYPLHNAKQLVVEQDTKCIAKGGIDGSAGDEN